ncbi:SRPBCC family protein [Sphingomonas sp.]|uniref:SRPBCC family protein n=1 Tax=Sphingomonas sp. TaxID=28214 RepID=UPI003752C92F
MSAFIVPEITQMAQLFPGPTPDKNRSVLSYMRRDPPKDTEEQASIEASMTFFRDVTYNEDYLIGLDIQKGLDANAHE